MAVSIEQQDGCLVQATAAGVLCGLSGPRGSEWPAVIRGIAAFAGVTLSSAGLERFAQLIAMECEDLVPEIVDQFEHGQCLFRRPEARYLDDNLTQMGGSLLRTAHALPPRRRRGSGEQWNRKPT
jgi:hypothetical protein